jgi:hypothetical protein
VVDLGKLVNYDFYHLEHYPPAGSWSVDGAVQKVNPGFDLENPPESLNFHPSGEDWGLVKYPLDMVRYATGQNAVAQAHSDQPRFKYLSFALLLFLTGVLMVLDKPLVSYISRWKRRTKAAWEIVRGQPVTKWPGVLKSHWVKRQSRMRRVEIED